MLPLVLIALLIVLLLCEVLGRPPLTIEGLVIVLVIVLVIFFSYGGVHR